MTVKEVLDMKDRRLITVDPSTNIVEAMSKLIENKVSCLPVMEESTRLIGMISDKDIFKAVYENQSGFTRHTVGELMTTELIVGVPEDKISYIASIMTNNRIRHIPILVDDEMIGLISVGDVAKCQMSNMEVENRYLKQYIDGGYPG